MLKTNKYTKQIKSVQSVYSYTVLITLHFKIGYYVHTLFYCLQITILIQIEVWIWINDDVVRVPIVYLTFAYYVPRD